MRDLILLAYMGVLLLVSAIPGGTPHGGHDDTLLGMIPPIVQNVLHIPAYGLLVLLWIRTLQTRGVAPRPRLLGATLAAAGFGAAMEVVQAWVPGRFPSAGDFLLNLAGVLLVAGIFRLAARPLPW